MRLVQNHGQVNWDNGRSGCDRRNRSSGSERQRFSDDEPEHLWQHQASLMFGDVIFQQCWETPLAAAVLPRRVVLD